MVGISTGNPRVIPGPRLTHTCTRQNPYPHTLGFSQPRVLRVWVHHGYTMGTATGCIHVRRFKYILVKSIMLLSPGLRRPSLAAVGLRGLSFRLCGPALSFVGCCGPSWAFVNKL